MIKMLRHAEVNQKMEFTADLLKEVVQRNFGGSDNSQRILSEFLRRCQFSSEIEADPTYETMSIISKSIDRGRMSGMSGRYLLLETENAEAALSILYSGTGLSSSEVDLISGSNFPKDQGFGMICANLRRVRLCMETDRTLICKDLDACLEALYDLLNQFFMNSLGKRWVDLGLGNERMQCPVGDGFRIIIFANSSQVASFPIPLLNRLEKHRLTIQDVLSHSERESASKILTKLQDWAGRESLEGNTNDEMSLSLPGFCSDTVPSFIVSQIDAAEIARNDERCLEALFDTVTPELILRSRDSGALSRYFEKQTHHSLVAFISSELDPNAQEVSRAIITTYDTLQSTGILRQEILGIKNRRVGLVEIRYIEDFGTEISFVSALSINLRVYSYS